MSFFTVFLLAVALSMDAFAVALASGCAIREVRLRQYVRVSAAFGFFQFFMPVLGWFLGQSVHHFIEAWDHWLPLAGWLLGSQFARHVTKMAPWIAFVLLAWIGGNMLRSGIGGLRKNEPVSCPQSDPTAGWNLLLLAVATSIDALAVGLTFAMTNTFLSYRGGLRRHLGLRALFGQKAVLAAHAQRLGRGAGRRGAAVHRPEHPARERCHLACREGRRPLPDGCRAAPRCPIVPEARRPSVPQACPKSSGMPEC